MAHDDDVEYDDGDTMTPAEMWADLLDFEADVRARQHSVSKLDDRYKREGRTDLMPGRQYAIALTALEDARLRIAEAGRCEEMARGEP